MAGKFILLTGGTGHIGFRTLAVALQQGYKVRAAVRSESKIEVLKLAPSTQQYLSQLSFTVVPDIEKEGAFDEAVKGVDAIIHLASSLAGPHVTDYERDMIQPAINGTLSILKSALKEPSVKRVVITSSIAAVRPAEDRVYTADNVEADPHGPYENPFLAYVASKKLALNRTRDFIKENSPQFSVMNVMPGFVLGKNELATTPAEVASGSNSRGLVPLLGEQNTVGMPNSMCFTDDVAEVHVAALNPDLKGNLNFGVSYDYRKQPKFDDAISIAKKHFPEAIEKGILPLGGTIRSIPTSFDASKTEELLRIKFKDQEVMIKSLAGWYIELSERAAAKSI